MTSCSTPHTALHNAGWLQLNETRIHCMRFSGKKNNFFLRLCVREMISDKCIVVYFPIILDACIYDSLVLQSARQLLRTESGALIPSLCTEKAFWVMRFHIQPQIFLNVAWRQKEVQSVICWRCEISRRSFFSDNLSVAHKSCKLYFSTW